MRCVWSRVTDTSWAARMRSLKSPALSGGRGRSGSRINFPVRSRSCAQPIAGSPAIDTASAERAALAWTESTPGRTTASPARFSKFPEPMNTNVTSRAGQGTNLAVAGRRMAPGQTLIDRLILYAPLALLPLLAFAFRNKLPAWGFMWLLAFAIFLGCKWLTWQQCRASVAAPQWKSWAYLFGWPGLDAKAFLSQGRPVTRPSLVEWAAAVAKTALGATLLGSAAEMARAAAPAGRVVRAFRPGVPSALRVVPPARARVARVWR